MSGIAERVEQADGDGLDALRLEEVDRPPHLGLVDRDRTDPSGPIRSATSTPPAPFHERRRRHVARVVELGRRGAPEFEHVAEAGRGDQGRPRAATLEDRVGRDGRAVDGLGAGTDGAVSMQRLDDLRDGATEVRRGGGDLVHRETAVSVDERDVRERSADVRPDACRGEASGPGESRVDEVGQDHFRIIYHASSDAPSRSLAASASAPMSSSTAAR